MSPMLGQFQMFSLGKVRALAYIRSRKRSISSLEIFSTLDKHGSVENRRGFCSKEISARDLRC
jgi:hypothetical protein